MPSAPVNPTPHHRLTPQMRSVLERMAKAGRAPLNTMTPQQAREAYAAGADILEEPAPVLARVEDFTIPARDGVLLPARLYAPTPAQGHPQLPVLLYFHGGGFVIGSITTHDGLCRALSSLAGCAVVSLDYRLAPEHRFPVAVNDAHDAMQWLALHGNTLGLDGSRLAVGGDSAGGTLAAVCALLARDAGLPLALQMLFYPGCAALADTPSHHQFAQGLVLEAAQIDWFFGNYINVAERGDWRFSPLNVPDAEGVAPAWIGLAEYDPLVDEGVLYADKLRQDRVAVELEIYRGVTHEFIKMGRAIPEARQARRDAARALQTAFEQALRP